MTTDSDFALYLAVLGAGFEMRQRDAKERAERARDNYLFDLRFHRSQAVFRPASKHHAARAIEAEARVIAITELLEKFRHANLDGRGAASTAESAVRPKPSDAIGRLRRGGHLNHEQERWAIEIARVFEGICGSLMSRGRPLAMMRGGKGVRLEFGVERTPEFITRLHHDYYLPWMQAMIARKLPRGLVIDVVVFGVSLHQIKRRYRCGWESALAALVAALDLYGAVKGGWYGAQALHHQPETAAPKNKRPRSKRGRGKRKAAPKVPRIKLGAFKHAYTLKLPRK